MTNKQEDFRQYLQKLQAFLTTKANNGEHHQSSITELQSQITKRLENLEKPLDDIKAVLNRAIDLKESKSN